MHKDTKLSLIKLNCAVERQEEEKTMHPGDNKNDLLIAKIKKASREKVIIRNFQFKLRKIMKVINNRKKRELWIGLVVLWLEWGRDS